jgi:hypothetical protein
VLEHERCLDLRGGVLHRDVAVALAGRARGADPQHAAGVDDAPLDVRDELRDRARRRRRARIVLQSELVANEDFPGAAKEPAHTAAVLADPARAGRARAPPLALQLMQPDPASGIGVAVGRRPTSSRAPRPGLVRVERRSRP